jgi:hypothetical protein
MNDDWIKPISLEGFPVGNVVPIRYAHLLRHIRRLRDIERQIQEALSIPPEMLTDKRPKK